MEITQILARVDWQSVAWVALGFVAVLGLLAVLSPRLFSRVATYSGTWLDTNKLLKKLDHRVDIDHFVIRHSRVFGVLVIGAAAVLACLLL